MTPLDLTQCPPPEGWGPWKEDDDFANSFVLRGGGGAVYLRQPTGLPAGQWQLCVEKGDDCIVIYTTLADLPSAYRRALQAVGLASPWTSEVPTTWGDYIVRVHETAGRGTIWTLGEGGWVNPSGSVGMAPTFAKLFMPCPQPPKET